MTKKRYFAMKEWFAKHKFWYNVLKFIYKALPYVMFVAAPALMIIKGFMGIDMDFFRMIYVPLAVLIVVSILRNFINKPRPYEVYETDPVIKRDGKGKSCPSRHTASAFIIAMCAIPVNLTLTIVLLAISFLIALSRIFGGVHFIRDVIAGAAASVITGFIFFVLL